MYEINDLKVLYTMLYGFCKFGTDKSEFTRWAKRLHTHIKESNGNIKFSAFEKNWIIWQSNSQYLTKLEKIALKNIISNKENRIKNYMFLQEITYVNKICDL